MGPDELLPGLNRPRSNFSPAIPLGDIPRVVQADLRRWVRVVRPRQP